MRHWRRPADFHLPLNEYDAINTTKIQSEYGRDQMSQTRGEGG